jgi:hypothetical protein
MIKLLRIYEELTEFEWGLNVVTVGFLVVKSSVIRQVLAFEKWTQGTQDLPELAVLYKFCLSIILNKIIF